MSYTEEVRGYIRNKFRNAKEQGTEHIDLNAKEIHGELNYKNRFPIVCNAMNSLMTDKDIFINTTESGQSSTIVVRYILSDK
jgi:hypothetical protein